MTLSPPQHDLLISQALEFLNPLAIGSDRKENTPSTLHLRPQTSPEPPKTPLSAGAKRVTFSSPLHQPDVTSPRQPRSNNSPDNALPKSILRPPSHAPLQEEVIPPFSSMIDTATKTLADGDVEARTDTYALLRRRLSALAEALTDPDRDHSNPEKNNPENEPLDVITASLQSAVLPFSAFFLRDLDPQTGAWAETRMPMAALRCLLCFLRNVDTAEVFTPRFYVSLLDIAISILTRQGPVQKFVAKSVVLVLDCIAFRAHVIPREKYRPLLESLKSLRTVRSNGIFGVRLAIYSGLVLENAESMASFSPLWIQDVFEGFLCPVADLRTRAIRLAEFSGSMPVRTSELASGLSDFFRTQSSRSGTPNGSATTTYFSFFLGELRKMLKALSPDMKRDVPRIWSAVILMLRNFRGGVDKCGFFKPLLTILQSCLNSVEGDVRIRSFVSLNTLVYAVMPTDKMDRAVRRLLILPVTERVSAPPSPDNVQGQRVWQAAMLSWVNLLYYSFRPGANDQALALSWEEYVAEPVRKIARWKSPAHVDFVSRVISCLLWRDESLMLGFGAGVAPGDICWKEERAVLDLSIEGMSCLPEELPQLPPLWIRKNLGTVLRLLERIFSPDLLLHGTSSCPSSGLLSDDPHNRQVHTDDFESPVFAIFPRLLSAITAAGAREVRPTSESQSALFQIVEFVDEVWRNNCSYFNVQNVYPFLEMVERLAEVFKTQFVLRPSHRLLLETQPAEAPIHTFIRCISLVAPLIEDGESDECAVSHVIPEILKATVQTLTREQFLICFADVIETVMTIPSWADDERREELLNRLLLDGPYGCEQSSWRPGNVNDVKSIFEEPLERIVKSTAAASDTNQTYLANFYRSCCTAARASASGNAGGQIVILEGLAAKLLTWETENRNGNGYGGGDGTKAVPLSASNYMDVTGDDNHRNETTTEQRDRTIAVMTAIVLQVEKDLGGGYDLSAIQSARQALSAGAKSSCSSTPKATTPPARSLGIGGGSGNPFDALDYNSILRKRPAWAGSDKSDPYCRFYELIRHGIGIQSRDPRSSDLFVRTVQLLSAFLASSFGYCAIYQLASVFPTIIENQGCQQRQDEDNNMGRKDELMQGWAEVRNNQHTANITDAVTTLWTTLCDRVQDLRDRNHRLELAQFLIPVWVKGLERKDHFLAQAFSKMCISSGWATSQWEALGLGVVLEVWTQVGFAAQFEALGSNATPGSLRSKQGLRVLNSEDDEDDEMYNSEVKGDKAFGSPAISKQTFALSAASNLGPVSSGSNPGGSSGTPFKSPLRAQLQAQIHPHTFSPAHFTAIISSPVKGEKHSAMDDSDDEEDAVENGGDDDVGNEAMTEKSLDEDDNDDEIHGRTRMSNRRVSAELRDDSPTPGGRGSGDLEGMISLDMLERNMNGPADPDVVLAARNGEVDMDPDVNMDTRMDVDLDIPSSPPELLNADDGAINGEPISLNFSVDANEGEIDSADEAISAQLESSVEATLLPTTALSPSVTPSTPYSAVEGEDEMKSQKSGQTSTRISMTVPSGATYVEPRESEVAPSPRLRSPSRRLARKAAMNRAKTRGAGATVAADGEPSGSQFVADNKRIQDTPETSSVELLVLDDMEAARADSEMPVPLPTSKAHKRKRSDADLTALDAVTGDDGHIDERASSTRPRKSLRRASMPTATSSTRNDNAFQDEHQDQSGGTRRSSRRRSVGVVAGLGMSDAERARSSRLVETVKLEPNLNGGEEEKRTKKDGVNHADAETATFDSDNISPVLPAKQEIRTRSRTSTARAAAAAAAAAKDLEKEFRNQLSGSNVPTLIPSSPIPERMRRRRSCRLNPTLAGIDEEDEGERGHAKKRESVSAAPEVDTGMDVDVDMDVRSSPITPVNKNGGVVFGAGNLSLISPTPRRPRSRRRVVEAEEEEGDENQDRAGQSAMSQSASEMSDIDSDDGEVQNASMAKKRADAGPPRGLHSSVKKNSGDHRYNNGGGKIFPGLAVAVPAVNKRGSKSSLKASAKKEAEEAESDGLKDQGRKGTGLVSSTSVSQPVSQPVTPSRSVSGLSEEGGEISPVSSLSSISSSASSSRPATDAEVGDGGQVRGKANGHAIPIEKMEKVGGIYREPTVKFSLSDCESIPSSPPALSSPVPHGGCDDGLGRSGQVAVRTGVSQPLVEQLKNLLAQFEDVEMGQGEEELVESMLSEWVRKRREGSAAAVSGAESVVSASDSSPDWNGTTGPDGADSKAEARGDGRRGGNGSVKEQDALPFRPLTALNGETKESGTAQEREKDKTKARWRSRSKTKPVEKEKENVKEKLKEKEREKKSWRDRRKGRAGRTTSRASGSGSVKV